MLKVAITGGIGSGKSNVCHLFEMFGAKVYYSDQRAKELMVNDPAIRRDIIDLLGTDAYLEGRINREYISNKIFSNRSLLAKINTIVHPAVFNDYRNWCLNSNSDICFLESAILFECGMDRIVDRIIVVSAPEEIRIERIIKRDGHSRERAISIIKNQINEEQRLARSDYTIYCDNKLLVIPQVIDIYKAIQEESKLLTYK